MKQPHYRSKLTMILNVLICLSILHITSLYRLASAAELTNDSKTFEVPPEKKTKWDSIEKALKYNYGVCVEHCGNDSECLGKCQKSYKSRLEKEYQQLTQDQTSKLTPRKPSKDDKCPVCGMFVAKYPDWVCEIIYNDGSVYFFDGAKDLFKYYFNLQKYAPNKSEADISAIYVTEYYDMKLIDAQSAFYVIGSDVYGPMGRELIPFTRKEDAEEFMKDHKGRIVLEFKNVTPAIITTLD